MGCNIPTISIVIATRNSGKLLDECLMAIRGQNYPSDKIEVIIADNESGDETSEIAKKYGARLISISGAPPQVCAQRNAGANSATGEYVYMLDHDMIMSKNLLKNFADRQSGSLDEIDAWYVPEKIVSGNNLWDKIRTYERSFYNGTVIDAVRIIRRSLFDKIQYDNGLSNGPADWDFDIQLKRIGGNFGILKNDYVEHQEKYLSIWKYLSKKVGYLDGGIKYQNKWREADKDVYDTIIRKQYGIIYRFFMVFVEDGKWKRVLGKINLFVPMITLRILVGILYIFKR